MHIQIYFWVGDASIQIYFWVGDATEDGRADRWVVGARMVEQTGGLGVRGS